MTPARRELGRKPHVGLHQADIMAWIEEGAMVASVAEVAEHFDVHVGTARRALDGLVAQGKLIRDEYDRDGERLHHEHWRYGLDSG